MSSEWITLGRINTPNHLFWIGDPSLIIGNQASEDAPKAIGYDFDDFLDKINNSIRNGYVNLEDDHENLGLAMVFDCNPYYTMKIEARLDDNRVKEVRILLN